MNWEAELFPVIKYDEEHDIIHVHFAPYEFTEDEEIAPGVIVRMSARNPERLIMVTVMDYAKRYRAAKEKERGEASEEVTE